MTEGLYCGGNIVNKYIRLPRHINRTKDRMTSRHIVIIILCDTLFLKCNNGQLHLYKL